MPYKSSQNLLKYVTYFAVSVMASYTAGESLSILVPSHTLVHVDSYVCTSLKVSSSKESYIIGFRPHAEMSNVHHLLLFGCKSPGVEAKIWRCGNMGSSFSLNDAQESLPSGGTCSGGSEIILYAWARNAPNLTLPEDVGFEIGGSSGIHFLVVQFHSGDHHVSSSIKNNKMGNVKDYIGLELQITHKRVSKLAGVYLLGTFGMILPHQEVHLEDKCRLEEDKVIHPFAFRTHSHSLGTQISGYRVRKDAGGQFRWTLIGKKDPQLPQMFYRVAEALTVKQGDILAARCTMKSDRNWVTYIGPSKNDEMCNFYIMYYVEDDKLLDQNICFQGDVNYWSTGHLPLRNIPKDA